MTDYQRYVFLYYHHVALAGEDLRIIDSTSMSVPPLPDYDFMLVDEATVIRIHYGPDGAWIGPELLQADPAEYQAYKAAALAAAVPFLDFEESLKA